MDFEIVGDIGRVETLLKAREFEIEFGCKNNMEKVGGEN